jgi:hypothetical protein
MRQVIQVPASDVLVAERVQATTGGTHEKPPVQLHKRGSMNAGRGELALSELNPDMDGDGNVSKFEKEVYDMLIAADADGSGTLRMREVYRVVEKMVRQRRDAERLKVVLFIAGVVIFLLLCGMTGLTGSTAKRVQGHGGETAFHPALPRPAPLAPLRPAPPRPAPSAPVPLNTSILMRGRYKGGTAAMVGRSSSNPPV